MVIRYILEAEVAQVPVLKLGVLQVLQCGKPILQAEAVRVVVL
jgi:hypothetical protein